MKVKSESEVTQSCPTLHDPMGCSLPGSSIHGIFQARVLEWGAKQVTKALYTLSQEIYQSYEVCIIPVFHIRKAKVQNLNTLPQMQAKVTPLISHPIFRTSGHVFTLQFTGQNCQVSGRHGWVHIWHVCIFQNLHINSPWTHFLLPKKAPYKER